MLGRGCREGQSEARSGERTFILITVQRYTITSIDCTAWLAMGMIYGNVGNNQLITPHSTTPSYFGFSRLHITLHTTHCYQQFSDKSLKCSVLKYMQPEIRLFNVIFTQKLKLYAEFEAYFARSNVLQSTDTDCYVIQLCGGATAWKYTSQQSPVGGPTHCSPRLRADSV